MLQFLVAICPKFLLQKRGMGYAKIIHKKERKLKRKIDKCLRYLKQWVLRCLPKKRKKKEKEREMNKIAHVFLQSIFKFQTREICFNEHSRIRLATIYISTHMHILI